MDGTVITLQQDNQENWPGMEWWDKFSGGLLCPLNMEDEVINWNDKVIVWWQWDVSMFLPEMSWNGVQGSSLTWEMRDGASHLLPSSPYSHCNRQTFHRYRLEKILLFRSVAFSLIWLKAFGFESECCLSWELWVEQPERISFRWLYVGCSAFTHWSLIKPIIDHWYIDWSHWLTLCNLW